jgi:hypothetical protein
LSAWGERWDALAEEWIRIYGELSSTHIFEHAIEISDVFLQLLVCISQNVARKYGNE